MKFDDKQRFCKKYLSDFDEDHLLFKHLVDVPNYIDYQIDYVERLLKDLDKDRDVVPELLKKIKKLKEAKEWQNCESILWELDFFREIKMLNPDFIQETKEQNTVDIKATLMGENVFFEIKLLRRNDRLQDFKEKIERLESNLEVKLNRYSKDMYADNGLYEFIKNKINDRNIGAFVYPEDIDSNDPKGIHIEIYDKPDKTMKTSIRIPVLSEGHVTAEPLRQKIRDIWDDGEKGARYQIKNYSPVFLVIGCDRWQYDWEEFNEAFFDVKQLYGGGNESQRLHEEEAGLFYLNDSKCLNGVITRIHGKYYLFMNPRAKHKLSNDMESKLKEIFNDC